MNKLILLFLPIFIISCDHFKAAVNTDSTKPIDTVSVNKSINNVLDSMHMAFKARKNNAMLSYLADDGKYLGSDPAELWSKQQLSDYLSKVTDTTRIEYTISQRTILADEDGKSAVVYEQYFLPAMSTKMMVRCIGRVDFKDNRWLIDFYSWNFIPKNEEIKKLNAALGQQ